VELFEEPGIRALANRFGVHGRAGSPSTRTADGSTKEVGGEAKFVGARAVESHHPCRRQPVEAPQGSNIAPLGRVSLSSIEKHGAEVG